MQPIRLSLWLFQIKSLYRPARSKEKDSSILYPAEDKGHKGIRSGNKTNHSSFILRRQAKKNSTSQCSFQLTSTFFPSFPSDKSVKAIFTETMLLIMLADRQNYILSWAQLLFIFVELRPPHKLLSILFCFFSLNLVSKLLTWQLRRLIVVMLPVTS